MAQKKTQKEQVEEAMNVNGGYATLQQLNALVDVNTWNTKTPFASIRRIVQTHPTVFFRIRPGLWALKYREKEVLQRLSISSGDRRKQDFFTHSYYQGIIVEIGNMHKFDTFIPMQDKNHMFLEKRLIDIATKKEMPAFSYEKIVKKARTVDVIWFNSREMPCRFYEVEHSTDIQHSLDKFYELQDFRAKFYIIADQSRERQYNELINNSIYHPIKEYVSFFSYDRLVKQYESELSVTDRI